MCTNLNTINLRKITTLICLLVIFCVDITSQTTTVEGVVKDADTGLPLEYVTVRFENSSIGMQTKENGTFRLSNRQGKILLVASLIGYSKFEKTVTLGTTSKLEILLKPTSIELDEVIIKPGKEKYSKKDNPAVTLIKKVIENKNKHQVKDQNYYQVKEYDRLFFSLNDFDASKSGHKVLNNLSQYTATSKIDNKPILPFSMRETLSSFYYRKNPAATKRIIEAYKMDGIDKGMNVEAINTYVKEVIKDVDITDNNINLLLRDFVGPLNSNISVDFYRWYIIDTVTYNDKKYINLGFVPFNTRDAGFIGNIYVSADSTYAIRRLKMTVPKNANVNYVDAMIVDQEFEEIQPNIWALSESTIAMDLSFAGSMKIYTEKVKTFSDYTVNMPVDAVFLNPAPEIYLSDYKKMNSDFWNKNRPQLMNQNYNVDSIMSKLLSNKLFRTTLNVINIFANGYVPTNKDEDINKLNIGTPLTLFSYNDIEGARFRLTGATTTNFNNHLFLYGYGAFGAKDLRPKYMAEVTWSFRKKEKSKEEFPISSISFAHKYDLNPIGQKYLQAERDNILMSLGSNRLKNATYAQMSELSLEHELYNNFSFGIKGYVQSEKPAGEIQFKKVDENGNEYIVDKLRTTEVSADIRFAPGEKFYIRNRKRRPIPSQALIFNATYAVGLKDVLGGDYNYRKGSVSISKELWIAPLGKIYARVTGEKIWGSAPYTTLITPNANTSFFIQKGGSFSLIDPAEFMNDQQISWNIDYNMGGWLFNRIPVFQLMKLREVFGFRGFWGKLSDGNNPVKNHDLFILPNYVHSLGKDPYMEINVGLENIFGLFRIDYVRRLNYLHHENTDKDGFRIGMDFSF